MYYYPHNISLHVDLIPRTKETKNTHWRKKNTVVNIESTSKRENHDLVTFIRHIRKQHGLQYKAIINDLE